MNDCIFCKIIKGEIPSTKLYEDDKMIVIKDIDPKAKLHYLAIPKEHYSYLSDMDSKKSATLGEMFRTISDTVPTLGLQDGYRVVINQGENAGQTVFHFHIHLLGGQELPFEKAK